jgi:enoyl-CoA hydratase/3-hydroxyacyl-CoA dehydrogenase
MPLVEVVRTKKTSPQVMVDLINMGKIMKKIPITTEDTAGFAVNRIFFPYGMTISFVAVELGIHPYRIDKILKDFGFAMGPFR